jgi:mannose-6-phosphate isomerase-like protein (cupin superfamily)
VSAGDPLEGRVWRFGETEPSPALFVDTALPGGARRIWSIIGQNVGEDRSVQPPIPPEDFHLAIVEAEPGNGSHLHTHTTAEVFVALTGRWALPYAESADGEVREVVLEPWDVCSVPAGLWRGFRNAGDARAHLLVVVGGTDAGRLTWAPDVLEASARAGRALDAEGFMAAD